MKISKTREKNRMKFMDIVLWGPSGAGKDFLIKGFIEETEKLNNNDTETSNVFNYEIPVYDGHKWPAIQKIKTPVATSNAESKLLEFRRKFSQDGKKRNPYFFTHYHHVVIHNNQGGELVKVTNEESEDPMITTPFALAENFIVVLEKPSEEEKKPAVSSNSTVLNVGENDLEALLNDISPESGFVNDYQNDINGNNVKIPTYSRDFYYRNLQMLFNYLNKNKTEGKKKVAICLTKADQHDVEGNPEFVLGQLFGKEFLTLINHYEKDYQIKIFLTTTEGFRNHNANPANPTFKNPTNTASPFFWFFEEAEKERLSKNCPRLLAEARLSERNHVPYPAPES